MLGKVQLFPANVKWSNSDKKFLLVDEKNFSLLPNLLFQSSTFVMVGGLVCKTMYLAKPSQQQRCWHDKLFAKTHYYTKLLINFFDKFVSAESLLGFDIHPITSSCIATLLPLNPTFDRIPIWLESGFNPILLIDAENKFLKSNFKSISQNVPKKLNKSSPGRCRTPNVGRWEKISPQNHCFQYLEFSWTIRDDITCVL